MFRSNAICNNTAQYLVSLVIINTRDVLFDVLAN